MGYGEDFLLLVILTIASFTEQNRDILRAIPRANSTPRVSARRVFFRRAERVRVWTSEAWGNPDSSSDEEVFVYSEGTQQD